MKPKVLNKTLYPHEWLLQSKFIFIVLALGIGMIFGLGVVGPMVFETISSEPASAWCTTTTPYPSSPFPAIMATIVGIICSVGVGVAVFYLEEDL